MCRGNRSKQFSKWGEIHKSTVYNFILCHVKYIKLNKAHWIEVRLNNKPTSVTDSGTYMHTWSNKHNLSWSLKKNNISLINLAYNYSLQMSDLILTQHVNSSHSLKLFTMYILLNDNFSKWKNSGCSHKISKTVQLLLRLYSALLVWKLQNSLLVPVFNNSK